MGSIEAAFSEVQRVRRHLRRAERAASAASVAHLSSAQRRRRAWLLAELALYRERGRFPKNREFRGKRVPVFVDPEGTRCAVGHLLELSGQHELVRRVQERVNHVRVKELANERELRAWLAWSGLTLEEAALIQPTYCWEKRTDCWCGSADVRSENGLLEVTIVTAAEQNLARARVDAVHSTKATVVVGDEVDVRDGSSEPGTTLWIQSTPYPYASPMAYMVLPYTVTADSASCIGSESFTLPVPKDVALRAALSLRKQDCRAVLAEHDSAWVNDEPCESTRGCSYHGAAGGASLAPALAVAVFVSICGLGRARRAWPKRGDV